MAFTNRRIIPVPGFWDRCLELQFLEANFCWLIRSLLLLSYSDCMIRMKTLPLLVDWTTSTKNVFQHRPGDSKEENTAAVRCSFDLQTWGLQSAPIPWFFLGNGRCCKPWRCHLEHFFGPRPEKVPWNLAFFKRELHDQRRCEPCLYYRKQGCWYGDECWFCHLCTAEQIRKWQSRQHYNRRAQHREKLQEEGPTLDIGMGFFDRD